MRRYITSEQKGWRLSSWLAMLVLVVCWYAILSMQNNSSSIALLCCCFSAACLLCQRCFVRKSVSCCPRDSGANTLSILGDCNCRAIRLLPGNLLYPPDNEKSSRQKKKTIRIPWLNMIWWLSDGRTRLGFSDLCPLIRRKTCSAFSLCVHMYVNV